MLPTWSESRDGFEAAATWLAQLIDDLAADDPIWQQPGLGVWAVRDLVGHAGRAMSTVVDYLDKGAAAVETDSVAAYFTTMLGAMTDADAVAERGRAAGQALGDDPSTAVRQLASTAMSRLADCDGSELVGSPAGGMDLRTYLPTRVFELVVHGSDLAVALGKPSEPPAVAAAIALSVITELAIAAGESGELLRAATGRPVDLPNVLSG